MNSHRLKIIARYLAVVTCVLIGLGLLVAFMSKLDILLRLACLCFGMCYFIIAVLILPTKKK